MTNAADAISDRNWLEPDVLYLTRGDAVWTTERDRPIYQGDVFEHVPVPALPKTPPGAAEAKLSFSDKLVMIVPHPCQCYFGDKLRPYLTVAPLQHVENYNNFGEDGTGCKDRFALPSLTYRSNGVTVQSDFVANFSRLISVPSRWLPVEKRVACLSHQGLGLLAKRVLGFQLRDTTTSLSVAMAYTQHEWNESFLMQAWVRKYRSLEGFTEWLRTPRVIKGLGGGSPVVPSEYRASALDLLLEAITGEPILEPDE